MSVMTGHPDFAGVALVHGAIELFENNTFHAAPGQQTDSTSVIPITRPGYEFRFTPNFAGLGPTVPFVAIDLYWYGPDASFTIAHERWVLGCSNSASNIYRTLAEGPTKGAFLQMYFSNFDPALTAGITIYGAQTTQHLNRDDWRGIPEIGAVPATFAQLPNAYEAAENSIANDFAVALGASATETWLLPLYAGDAAITLTTPDAAPGITFTLTDPVTGNVFWTGTATTAAPVVNATVTLPRRPMLLTAKNGVAAATTFNVVITAREYAS